MARLLINVLCTAPLEGSEAISGIHDLCTKISCFDVFGRQEKACIDRIFYRDFTAGFKVLFLQMK